MADNIPIVHNSTRVRGQGQSTGDRTGQRSFTGQRHRIGATQDWMYLPGTSRSRRTCTLIPLPQALLFQTDLSYGGVSWAGAVLGYFTSPGTNLHHQGVGRGHVRPRGPPAAPAVRSRLRGLVRGPGFADVAAYARRHVPPRAGRGASARERLEAGEGDGGGGQERGHADAAGGHYSGKRA